MKASSLLGNSGSAGTTGTINWQEIVVGNQMNFYTGGSTAYLGVTSTPTFTSITATTATLTSATVTTLTYTTLTNVTTVANGGTGASSVAVANQNIVTPTVTLTPSASVAVNWALGNNFNLSLNTGTTLTFSNAVDGQVILIAILNTASNFTVTWPGTVKWSGGSAPTMSTGVHYDIYNIAYNSSFGVYFGTYVQNF